MDCSAYDDQDVILMSNLNSPRDVTVGNFTLVRSLVMIASSHNIRKMRSRTIVTKYPLLDDCRPWSLGIAR